MHAEDIAAVALTVEGNAAASKYLLWILIWFDIERGIFFN